MARSDVHSAAIEAATVVAAAMEAATTTMEAAAAHMAAATVTTATAVSAAAMCEEDGWRECNETDGHDARQSPTKLFRAECWEPKTGRGAHVAPFLAGADWPGTLEGNAKE
jgi:hypothetical protein